MTSTAEQVLAFWFADSAEGPALALERGRFWFAPSRETDEACAGFAAVVEQAAAGALQTWEAEARSALALVLLLDQLPRNLYRDTPRAFESDRSALEVTERLLSSEAEAGLPIVHRTFARMPFMHSEELAVQERGIAHFEALVAQAPEAWKPFVANSLDYSRGHRDVIARFGRFPHRNAILGRPPTPAEEAYLAGGGDTYGQGAG